MIFVTVGNMDPFDRLIEIVDRWADAQNGQVEVVAQIGKGTYRPQYLSSFEFLAPTHYRETFAAAKLVVSHAGMGSIITALELRKPMIIMPKRASLGEQRNDHQLATARRFRRSELIQVAMDEQELWGRLDAAIASPDSAASVQHWPPDPSLISFVREFVAAPSDAAATALQKRVAGS